MTHTVRLGSFVLPLLLSLVGCTDSASPMDDDQMEQPGSDDGSDAPDAPPALAAGSLDPAFGANGIVTLPNIVGFAGDIAAQGDKLLVCVNEIEDGNVTARIYRYDASGALDTTFGTEGRVSLLVADWPTYCKDLEVTSDSFYAVVNAMYPMSEVGNFIRQYSADGELLHTANGSSVTHVTALADDTIASSGLVSGMAEGAVLSPELSGSHLYSAETGAEGAVRAFLFDGKLAVVAQFSNAAVFTTLLVQDDASNDLVDAAEQRVSFGMAGLTDYVMNAAQLPDGSVFAVGSVDYGIESMAIRWVHGAQTEAFHEHHAIGEAGYASGLALDQAGRPIVVGVAVLGGQRSFMWQRYAASSVTLDAGYQHEGVATLASPSGEGELSAATELNGSIYALGSVDLDSAHQHIVIAKIAE